MRLRRRDRRGIHRVERLQLPDAHARFARQAGQEVEDDSPRGSADKQMKSFMEPCGHPEGMREGSRGLSESASDSPGNARKLRGSRRGRRNSFMTAALKRFLARFPGALRRGTFTGGSPFRFAKRFNCRLPSSKPSAWQIER